MPAIRKIQHEAREQEALFAWIRMQEKKHPELRLCFAIPNGGFRKAFEAHKLTLQGVRKGVPDLFLSVPRQGQHGLYLEMKYGKNKPSDEQKDFICRLMEQGYRVRICYGWQEAQQEIKNYLEI